jgi:hypothetical protein
MSFFRSFLCFAVEIMNTEKLFNMIIQAGNWFDTNKGITYMKQAASNSAEEVKWNRENKSAQCLYRFARHLHFLQIMIHNRFNYRHFHTKLIWNSTYVKSSSILL